MSINSAGNVHIKNNLEVGTSLVNVNSVGDQVYIGSAGTHTIAFGESPRQQVHQVRGTHGNPLAAFTWGADAVGARIALGKSRGADIGTHALPIDTDELGGTYFCGSDGIGDMSNVGAAITANVNGTPSSTSLPTELNFLTSDVGETTPSTKMTIDPSGKVGIGTNNPDRKFHVNNSDSPAELNLSRTTAGNFAANTDLGLLNFGGSEADGTDYQAARVKVVTDEAWGSTAQGTAMAFMVNSTGTTTATETLRLKSSGTLNANQLSTFADDTAAGSGGLVAGDIYKTSTGELRIKL